ncbi:UNVERIFIED_CONTAM: Retrovirus-related Pol polyprotein from type-2 retrotransposable element R2DM [Sesamum radiatum]|uniref:Retrovirus-related Pol polyprotein from type-2 retrotransposable element R2DM n=1 Tax=Sesamum radiatum TaxID=300843 RepID=A0AAW2T4Y6_SESRA
MWDKLLEVGQPLTLPWLVLGDFNCVKSTEEKQLGVMPTWYELKDFNDCCLSLGLSDADDRMLLHMIIRIFLQPWRSKKLILAITKSDGSTITSTADIGQEFVTYFTSLLGTAAQTLPVDNDVFDWGPKLSLEHASELCKEVTPLEVKQAIFHICDTKAPGPDGFSACFFKKAWNIVGDQVCLAVTDFFRSGRLLRQLNHCIIALVPKSEHSPTVADYRPISCCNVIYKAITKIIADRLSTVLEHLIDRSQAAFVGGRSITDNIFLAQEMVRQYTRKRISPRCTINVDLRKAFDSVSWTFLSRVLHGYGFPPPFITWIMECVSTSSFSVALNGSLHGFFPGKRGLRQGDPMSPALFLLSMEYFSRLVKRRTSDSEFNFHPKCEKLKITHLLFADDLMLFSRGDLPSISILMECLQEFRDVSGLAVNTSKSSIFTAGIHNDELHGILARTEFVRGAMPVRYLGIPLAAQRLSVSDYSPLVDQIAKSISKWAAKSLSYAGRLELIRSVIQGVECFWLQIFPLPAAVVEKIHRLCRNFLWNSRCAPVAWAEICHPKEEGGLGIRHIQSWNVALLARVLWNIHRKSDTLWVQWVNGVYLRAAQFGIGNRRRATHHSFNGLPRFATGISQASFFECPFSDYVWSNIRDWVGLSRRMSTLLSAMKWLKKEKTGSSVQNKARRIALACTVYSLWRHRNEVVFEAKAPCPDGLVISIRISVYRQLLTLPHGLIAH